jgi:hypothetical protein
MFDGTTNSNTSDDWFAKRRNEIKQLFQHYMYGHLPPRLTVVDVQIDYQNDFVYNGKATMYQLEVPPLPEHNVSFLCLSCCTNFTSQQEIWLFCWS